MKSPVSSAPLQRLSTLYEGAVALRNRVYDRGLANACHISGAVVVSVGNIAAGGRGKSPLAMYLANWFSQQGYPTALLLRGYRGRMERRGGPVIDRSGRLMPASQCGDEAWQAAHMCPDVDVRAGANRVRQAQAAYRRGARCILLDDGFQHRRMHRDLDAVIVNPADLHPDADCLPAGHLREPPSSLRRADILLGQTTQWKGLPNPPPILFSTVPETLEDMQGRLLPLSLPWSVHALCGIANPAGFHSTLGSLGAQVVSSTVFADHHRYTGRDVERCRETARDSGAQAIITTVKDMGKLREIEAALPILALRMRVRIDEGEPILLALLHRLLRPYRDILSLNP